MDWYRLDAKEVFERLGATAAGLGGEEAKRRLSEFGPNRLAEEERISRLLILLHQFASPLIVILLVAAVVTFALEEYVDAGVIASVVLLNALIGYVQEFKAEESVRGLKKLVVPKAKVIREGREREVASEDLAPGDIVLLASGTRVPADLRLLSVIEARVDEALLTGESVPAEKSTATIREENLIPGDQRNMAFMGTIVVGGRARGIVVETGGRTVLGGIAEQVRGVREAKTPLQERLERFTLLIAAAVLALSATVFGVGLALGARAAEMFQIAVATAVSAIPEGLPVAVTIAMAIGVSRMARRHSIVRRLPAVETLGSTTVIGSDKTGTLTKNEMTVTLAYDGEAVYEITGVGYGPAGEIRREEVAVDAREHRRLLEVLRIGLLCNESSVYEEDGAWRVDGDPTEGALVVSAGKAGLDHEEQRKHYPQLAIIPFESEHGYMATLHAHRGRRLVFVKGAPERVLAMCESDASGEPLDRRRVLASADRFAREGLRVLAMASREVPRGLEEITRADVGAGLVFAGLQGMIDPPRPEVIEAIAGCRRAGIRVVMITGDHAVTAAAIARKIGIGDADAVLTGTEIETMSDEELSSRVGEVSVFARVAPEHKLRITRQLLERGEVVAVTGDGVNDAPALKAAHIGVAMGRTGTDVAKESAHMVVADDNFASIFAAVEEGRIVFDNIRKVVLFLVSCGFGELVAIAAAIAAGLPLPYTPAQILWLNLVTNGLQDVALAFEPGEKNVLARPPYGRRQGILSPLLRQRTLLMGVTMAAGTVALFAAQLGAGVALEEARTVALTTMVFFQFYQALNCRSEVRSIFTMSPLGNPFLFYSMIAAFFAQLAVLYVPALQWVFRTVPLGASKLGLIVLATASIVAVVEVDKWVRRRHVLRGEGGDRG